MRYHAIDFKFSWRLHSDIEHAIWLVVIKVKMNVCVFHCFNCWLFTFIGTDRFLITRIINIDLEFSLNPLLAYPTVLCSIECRNVISHFTLSSLSRRSSNLGTLIICTYVRCWAHLSHRLQICSVQIFRYTRLRLNFVSH